LALTICASTRARSDFKVRREAFLFPAISLPHAEYVSTVASRDITDRNHTSFEHTKADDASLTIVPTCVLDCLAGSHVRRMGYCSYKNIVGQTRSQMRFQRNLTVKLSGRPTTHHRRRGPTISPGTRGANQTTPHGPLQR